MLVGTSSYCCTVMIDVSVSGRENEFHSEACSSMTLFKMKTSAEAFLGSKTKDAVSRSPYSSDSQLQGFVASNHEVVTGWSKSFNALNPELKLPHVAAGFKR